MSSRRDGFEQTDDGIAIVDRHWRYVYFSASATPHLPAPREDLLGKIVWEAFPELAGTDYDAQLRSAVASGMPFARETEYKGCRFVSHCFPLAEGGALFRFRRLAARAQRVQIETRALDLEAASQQRPRVLVACPPLAASFHRDALARVVRLSFTTRFAEAVERIGKETDISLVVCGVHFDESRMFDLLRHCTKNYPDIPFVCCRVLDIEGPSVFLDAVRVSVESSGASFVDVARLSNSVGPAAARVALQAEVFLHARLPVPLESLLAKSEKRGKKRHISEA